MELKLVDSKGIPPGSIVSIKVGEVRRQAPVGSDRPYRFNGVGQGKQQMKVDVYAPVAHARLLIEPREARCSVHLDGVQHNEIDKLLDAEAMSLDLAVASCFPEVGISASEANVVQVSRPSSAQSDRSAPGATAGRAARRHQVALEAQPYLEKHHLMDLMQALLQGMLKEKPEDPYSFMIRILENSRSAAAGVTQQVQRQRPASAPSGPGAQVRHAQGRPLQSALRPSSAFRPSSSRTPGSRPRTSEHRVSWSSTLPATPSSPPWEASERAGWSPLSENVRSEFNCAGTPGLAAASVAPSPVLPVEELCKSEAQGLRTEPEAPTETVRLFNEGAGVTYADGNTDCTSRAVDCGPRATQPCLELQGREDRPTNVNARPVSARTIPGEELTTPLNKVEMPGLEGLRQQLKHNIAGAVQTNSLNDLLLTAWDVGQQRIAMSAADRTERVQPVAKEACSLVDAAFVKQPDSKTQCGSTLQRKWHAPCDELLSSATLKMGDTGVSPRSIKADAVLDACKIGAVQKSPGRDANQSVAERTDTAWRSEGEQTMRKPIESEDGAPVSLDAAAWMPDVESLREETVALRHRTEQIENLLRKLVAEQDGSH